MSSKLSIALSIAAAAAVLAGCATPQAPSGPSGKHLVYRDSAGKPMRQFDYPNDDFCKRVEALAGRTARCQADSTGAQLQAQATLRYSPPGVVVQGHYADMSRCKTDTDALPPGVELLMACKAK